MRIMDASHVGLVIAARAGDRKARDELIRAYLPLVYNIVGHALRGHPDVDDVVQETFLRAVRDLPAIRDPGSFRSWLVAIAVHQISSHMRRPRGGGAVPVSVEEPAYGAAGFEEAAIIRLQLSDQRRRVAEASRWLDPEHRVTASLWWQENAGGMSRREVAAALGLSLAHTAVRLQRMREQLDQGRAIVAALAAEPRCRRLATAIERWDGNPNPLWRKRIARHVRGCGECRAATGEQIPLERLLLTFAPLAVPAGLAAGLAAQKLGAAAAGSTAAAQVSVLGKLLQAVLAHPLASLATGTAVVIAGTVIYVAAPEPKPAPPVAVGVPAESQRAPAPPPATPEVVPSPTRPVPPSPESPSPERSGVPIGSWSLESVASEGHYLSFDGDFAKLATVADAQSRERATLTAVDGLADTDCVTFRTADGRFLRHSDLRLRLNADDGTELFREDATFCPFAGATSGSVTLRAHNYPALVLRSRDGGVYLDASDGTVAFGRESSFVVRDPLDG